MVSDDPQTRSYMLHTWELDWIVIVLIIFYFLLLKGAHKIKMSKFSQSGQNHAKKILTSNRERNQRTLVCKGIYSKGKAKVKPSHGKEKSSPNGQQDGTGW